MKKFFAQRIGEIFSLSFEAGSDGAFHIDTPEEEEAIDAFRFWILVNCPSASYLGRKTLKEEGADGYRDEFKFGDGSYLGFKTQEQGSKLRVTVYYKFLIAGE